MSMSSPFPKDVRKLADGSVDNEEFETLDNIDKSRTIESRLSALEAGGTQQKVYATKSSQQTGITAQAWTKIVDWTEHYDPANLFASDEFQAPSNGRIEVRANVIGATFGGGSTTQGFYIAVFKDGVIIPESISGSFIQSGWATQSIIYYNGPALMNEVFDIRFVFATNNTNAAVGAFTDALGATADATVRSQLLMSFSS